MFKAYKNYWLNTFKYRATSTRADFWWPMLVNFIILFILYCLLAIAGYASVNAIMNGYSGGPGFVLFLLWLILIYCLAIILPTISICVRRLRDAGLTGWTLLVFWLLSFIFTSNNSAILQSISVVIEIVLLVFLCLPTRYVSRHGWWSPNYAEDTKIPSLRSTEELNEDK